MAKNTILTPGSEYQQTTLVQGEPQYLEKDKYLGEFNEDGEKSAARANLGVPAIEDVYNKNEVNREIDKAIQKALQSYLDTEDPHGILPQVEEILKNFIKKDGTEAFSGPQPGVDPVSDSHLTTKKFVTRLLNDHKNAEDPHNIIPEVLDILEKYVQYKDIYAKSQLYTKQELDAQAAAYLKKDGSTAFTKPQLGIDPQTDSHLATKRYVDKVLYQHLVDVDPHGFLSILNNRLASYIKKSEVYNKTETYSRTQIDTIIRSMVDAAISSSISDYMEDINNKFEHIRKQRFVKQDGSIPFKNPQIGVDAINPNELTTLRQVQDLVEVLKGSLEKKIENKECEWVTSGKVLAEVGMVPAGEEFAKTVSLQEVMDAIFYGKGISITSDKFGKIGEKVDVTVCVQGSLATLEHAELYQNGELLASFTQEDFRESTCITVKSLPIMEDTEFVFQAFFINGSDHKVNCWTKVALPVFVGLLPKWQRGYTLTYDDLIQLYMKDPENNQFYDRGKKLKILNHRYNFERQGSQHYLLALPADYPDLYQMCTPSQQFGTEAFDIIDMIPFQVPNAKKDVVYKLYIYREAQIRANIPITFNFVENHE